MTRKPAISAKSAALQLSSTTTPDACFTQFWKLLSKPKAEIWREYQAAARGPRRQREALELLASVAWHLELAHSLAPWPKQKMQEFYSELLKQADALPPWKVWVDHYKTVKVTPPSATRILIDYSLSEGACVAAYAVQNTLIADAAMRLDSTREVLRTMSKQNSLVLLNRPKLQDRLQRRHVPRKVKDIAIVVAFRDSYLHAEITTKTNQPLADFRQKLRTRYSLFDVGMACLRVWLELHKLCMVSMR